MVHVKVTIKDIAKVTNLSTATVSRVLSDKKGTYRESTAKLVRDAAQKLGYHRNVAAADLASHHIRTVGVIINNATTNFHKPILDGIEAAAIKQDRQIIIFAAESNDEETLTKTINAALEYRLAGILLISTNLSQAQVNILNEANIPFRFVSIENPYDQKHLFISSNNVEISQLATNYLINHGHHKIALAGLDRSSTGRERLLGYQKAMTKADLAIDPAWIIYGDYSFENGKRIFKDLVKSEVTAVIAVSDMEAAGIINSASEFGYQLPDQLSIISIDGTFICQITEPQLSSVTQNFFEMGNESLLSLFDQHTGIYVPVKIEERGSVSDLK